MFSTEYRGAKGNDRSLWGAQFGEEFGEVVLRHNSAIGRQPLAQPLLETWSWTERSEQFTKCRRNVMQSGQLWAADLCDGCSRFQTGDEAIRIGLRNIGHTESAILFKS
jgi:hypothetical protein